MRPATYCTGVRANKATAAINLLYLDCLLVVGTPHAYLSLNVLLSAFSPPTFIATLFFPVKHNVLRFEWQTNNYFRWKFKSK